jgi:hypothetical protein
METSSAHTPRPHTAPPKRIFFFFAQLSLKHLFETYASSSLEQHAACSAARHMRMRALALDVENRARCSEKDLNIFDGNV